MERRLWISLLWLVVLMLATQSCAQPTVPESTATPIPPTDVPTEEPAPTDEPTATQEPTATTEPTATPEAETPTLPPTEEAEPPTLPPTEEAEPTPAPVDPEGQVLLDERCTGCHSLGRVTRAQKSRDGWETTVDRMIGLGARLNDDEKAVVIDYLVATYGD